MRTGIRTRRALALAALTVAVSVLAGCGAQAQPAPAPAPPSTPPPTIAAPVSTNNLTDEEIAEIAGDRCASAGLSADFADQVRTLDQGRADAVRFFATSGQCADLPAVFAATAQTGAAFASPVQYIEPSCAGGTILSFWAHYDDDLIFGNPTIQNALRDGTCVRTFFFTFSDAGEGVSTYAGERETGIRRAYDVMRGASGPWSDRSVTFQSGASATLTRPDGDPRVSLYFLRLPDGGTQGSLFEYTGEQTLEKLNTGELLSLRTLDSGRSVSRATLERTVGELVAGYAAQAVYTHLPKGADGADGDHPDHQAVGEIVAAATTAAPREGSTVVYAQGYPSSGRPANVSGPELDAKLQVFSAYAAHDPVLQCNDPRSCLARAHFGDWLQRQYHVPQGG